MNMVLKADDPSMSRNSDDFRKVKESIFNAKDNIKPIAKTRAESTPKNNFIKYQSESLNIVPIHKNQEESKQLKRCESMKRISSGISYIFNFIQIKDLEVLVQ